MLRLLLRLLRLLLLLLAALHAEAARRLAAKLLLHALGLPEGTMWGVNIRVEFVDRAHIRSQS